MLSYTELISQARSRHEWLIWDLSKEQERNSHNADPSPNGAVLRQNEKFQQLKFQLTKFDLVKTALRLRHSEEALSCAPTGQCHASLGHRPGLAM